MNKFAIQEILATTLNAQSKLATQIDRSKHDAALNNYLLNVKSLLLNKNTLAFVQSSEVLRKYNKQDCIREVYSWLYYLENAKNSGMCTSEYFKETQSVLSKIIAILLSTCTYLNDAIIEKYDVQIKNA